MLSSWHSHSQCSTAVHLRAMVKSGSAHVRIYNLCYISIKAKVTYKIKVRISVRHMVRVRDRVIQWLY